MNQPEQVSTGYLSQQIRIICGCCRRVVMDRNVIHNNVIKIAENGQAMAKCRCKEWVAVPLYFRPPQEKDLTQQTDKPE